MTPHTTPELKPEIEKRFDKQFSVVKYEQDGEKHEGFRTSKVPNSKDVKQFLAEALTTAREQERQRIIKQVEELISKYEDGCRWCNCMGDFENDVLKLLKDQDD